MQRSSIPGTLKLIILFNKLISQKDPSSLSPGRDFFGPKFLLWSMGFEFIVHAGVNHCDVQTQGVWPVILKQSNAIKCFLYWQKLVIYREKTGVGILGMAPSLSFHLVEFINSHIIPTVA